MRRFKSFLLPPRTGQGFLLSWTYQEALNVVLQAILQIVTFILIAFFDWTGTYIRRRLMIAVYCFFNIYAATGVLKLWLHGKKFERILNSVFVLERTMVAAGIQPTSTKYLRRSIIFGMAFVVLYTLAQILFIYVPLERGFYEAFTVYLVSGRTLLYGPTNCTSFGLDPIHGCQASIEIVFVGLIMWMSTGLTLLYIQYLNFFCFSHAAILLGLARALWKQINLSDASNNTANYVKVAKDMLRLANIMGDGIGAIVFYWCFSLIPYYSMGIQSVIKGTDYRRTLISLIDWFEFFVTLATAAEANATMKRVSSEILARLPTGPNGEMDEEFSKPAMKQMHEGAMILFHRTSANEYGLHGWVFTVTYSLAGSIAGLVVTYGIIIYQFRV